VTLKANPIVHCPILVPETPENFQEKPFDFTLAWNAPITTHGSWTPLETDSRFRHLKQCLLYYYLNYHLSFELLIHPNANMDYLKRDSQKQSKKEQIKSNDLLTVCRLRDFHLIVPLLLYEEKCKIQWITVNSAIKAARSKAAPTKRPQNGPFHFVQC